MRKRDLSKMAQWEMVLHHLQANKKKGISDDEARQRYGIKRLAAVIHVLRTKHGCNIITVWHNGKNRFGKECEWGTYRLA